MLELTQLVLVLTAGVPLVRAWLVNRHSTLAHTIWWTAAAWIAWVLVAAQDWWTTGLAGVQMGYLALSLSGCAGVAVLGARRPGVIAWHGVVAGLLLVLLLPFAEGLGELRLSPLSVLFLAGTLAAGVLNYLRTRLALAALVLAGGCAAQFWKVLAPTAVPTWLGSHAAGIVAVSPWLAWLLVRTRAEPVEPFDQHWLDFRDRFGGLWGLRVRDHFTRSATNNGWPLHLSWGGIEFREAGSADAAAVRTEALAVLLAVLKRFKRSDKEDHPSKAE